MRMDLLADYVRTHPYPLTFATISGAHLYGFASPDSDYDLRGMHVLPASHVLGLKLRNETVIREDIREGIEVDIVSQDVKKFFELLLKRNGYVLEQLYSPLIVHSTPAFEELKEIAKKCVTRHHVYHYLGFANNEWELFQKGTPKIKPLLYVFRVLLSGIHLMNTGAVEANLAVLAELYGQTFLLEFIEEKTGGKEKGEIKNPRVDFYKVHVAKLFDELKLSSERSSLPATPSAEPELNSLLVRLRLDTVGQP